MLPAAIDAVVGATVIVTSTAGVTVSAAVPWTSEAGSVAVMVVAPVPIPVASPVFEMVATEVSDDDQIADEVRFWVLRSE